MRSSGPVRFRTIALSALVALLGLHLAAVDASAQNLFLNADMEVCPVTPYNTPPADWGSSGTGSGIDCEWWATGIDPGIFGGSRSPRTQYTQIEGITQSVPTVPGTTYTVSFFVAGNGGTAEIREGTYTGTLIASGPITVSYTQILGTFVATVASTQFYIGTDLATGATGDARIDDACVSTDGALCTVPVELQSFTVE